MPGRHKEIRRVGHDREISIARQGEKMGALDKVDYNLPNSLKGADVIVLSLPADQVRETLEFIPPDLKPGAVVIDTAPTKDAVSGWADICLPEGCHYVGLLPALNAKYLQEHTSGVDAAHADLFHNSLMAIVAPPRSGAEAVQLAVNLTGILGAVSFFVDPIELDGLAAATHILPKLLSAVLVNATSGQPGWSDSRKIAGRAYAEVSGPIVQLDRPEALAAAVMHHQQNVVRMIDRATAALKALREDILGGDSTTLQADLENAWQARQSWWLQRQAASWPDENTPTTELPTARESFSRLFGVGRKKIDSNRK